MPKPQTNSTAIAGSSPVPYYVSLTQREVIESKLLTALEDEGTVAILTSEKDLKTLLAALRGYKGLSGPDEMRARTKDLGDGIEQLLREAFPQNTKEKGHSCP